MSGVQYRSLVSPIASVSRVELRSKGRSLLCCVKMARNFPARKELILGESSESSFFLVISGEFSKEFTC